MTKITTLSSEEAREYLLRAECYFRQDFPPYINFQKLIDSVAAAMDGAQFRDFQNEKIKPERLPGVNYSLIANKDGRFGWRPFEMIHPAIYVSLVNVMCAPENWDLIIHRFSEFESSIVECCGMPIIPRNGDPVAGAQVLNWWLEYEQKSLELSLCYSHVLQTDVTNCYGSLYTHSIVWALHGLPEGKNNRKSSLLGNKIDRHVQSSRYGQTNGIPQGSVLMDIVAELVLGYVDLNISKRLEGIDNIRILRYRDDYRVFSQSDRQAEIALKAISDCLRDVGMKLGATKTSSSTNIVEASIKPEKLAGIQLVDMDINEAKTIQKQLLRLHAFARKYPNSGALNRLASNAFEKIRDIEKTPDDIVVQIAIATDIAAISPQAFPAISGIIAKLISLAPQPRHEELWDKVAKKMRDIPHNGYLEIWLQRVTRAKGVELDFHSSEPICRVVDGDDVELWESSWIDNDALKSALGLKQILTGTPEELEAVPKISETKLFKKYSEFS
jgi:hypothetical protein